MSLHLNGVALVTGAGSGIGRECALGYAAEGARGVILADLDYEMALDAAQESETVATNPAFTALAMQVDVTDRGRVDDMIRTTVGAFGRIDYFVNCSGIGNSKTHPVSLKQADRVGQANLLGALHLVQAVATVMKTQSTNRYKFRRRIREAGRGTIITLGSAPDTIATHGIINLTRNAALENAEYGIRVNAICPGWVENAVDPILDLNGNVDPHGMKNIVPLCRPAKAEEIADVVLFLSSPRASYVTGARWLVDGGMTLQVQKPPATAE